jgi:hypothetical protein
MIKLKTFSTLTTLLYILKECDSLLLTVVFLIALPFSLEGGYAYQAFGAMYRFHLQGES